MKPLLNDQGRIKNNDRLGVISKIVGFILISVIIIYLSKKLYFGWNDIPFDKIELNYYFIILSFLGLLLSFTCSVSAWQMILKALESRMSFKKSWWVITGSYLAKYIPGHIWSIGGRVYLCKTEGISEKISGTAMILEMTALLLGSLTAFCFTLPFLIKHGLPSWIWYLLVPIPFALVVFFSPLLPISLKWLASSFLKKEIKLDIKSAPLFMAFCLFAISAIIQGGAFFLLVRSFYSIEYRFLPDIIGIYNGSWAVGFLSFVAPGGLGIREGALTVLSKFYIPLPMAIILSALARLWMTLFEIIMALIGLKFRK